MTTPNFKERAAQIWCEPKHEKKVMDTDMAESIAQALTEARQPDAQAWPSEGEARDWIEARARKSEDTGTTRTAFSKTDLYAASYMSQLDFYYWLTQRRDEKIQKLEHALKTLMHAIQEVEIHAPGYDWNSDPLMLTSRLGAAFDISTEALASVAKEDSK